MGKANYSDLEVNQSFFFGFLVFIILIFTLLHYTVSYSGADPGICERGAAPPVPFLFLLLSLSPLPSPLEAGPLKLGRGYGKTLKAVPVGSGAEPRPKTNLVHFKVVRKPLVAIISNIVSTMGPIFEKS